MKGVNYWGPNSEYVVSGSDCGHFFVWDRASTVLNTFLSILCRIWFVCRQSCRRFLLRSVMLCQLREFLSNLDNSLHRSAGRCGDA